MRQKKEVSPWPSATHNPYLQRFSTTNRTDPASDLYDMHFRATWARGNRIYRLVYHIRYGTLSCPSPTGHPLWLSYRLSSLLGHHLCCGTVQRIQGPDTWSVQDYSTRCDVLFPGCIHFASHGHVFSLIRKCKDIFIILYFISAARLDLYSLLSNCSLPGKWCQDAFPSFVHHIFSVQ